MLAPAPTPTRNRPGTRSQDEAVCAPVRLEGEPGRAGGDEQNADVEQVAAEPVDERVGADHAEDHPDDHRVSVRPAWIGDQPSPSWP